MSVIMSVFLGRETSSLQKPFDSLATGNPPVCDLISESVTLQNY